MSLRRAMGLDYVGGSVEVRAAVDPKRSPSQMVTVIAPSCMEPRHSHLSDRPPTQSSCRFNFVGLFTFNLLNNPSTAKSSIQRCAESPILHRIWAGTSLNHSRILEPQINRFLFPTHCLRSKHGSIFFEGSISERGRSHPRCSLNVLGCAATWSSG